MVEAGANEITEAELLDALEIAHDEIKKLCAAQRELARAPRQGEDRGRVAEGRRGAAGRRSRRRTATSSTARPRSRTSSSARTRPRPSRRRCSRSTPPTRATSRSTRAAAEVQRAFDKLEKDIIRRRIAVDKRRPDGRARGRDPRDLGRGRHRARARTAPRSSPAARRRRTRSRRSARAARSSASTRSGSRPSKRYFHHYNFPPFSVGEAGFMRGPKRRDIGHGALAERALAADDPLAGGLPVHDPRRVRHPRVQRLLVDGLGVRLDAVADGRGREDQEAGGRHRDGPDQGRGRLRRPVRHCRGGGPPGRHGLQGRRHARRHHRPADGHQDHGRHVRDPEEGARAGARGPAVHPRQDGGRRSPRRARS